MARIWVVEDDPKIALLIQMAMTKAGHETVHFLDAAEMEKALKKSETPELMLLDLMLREKNGFTVLKEWKERGATNGIPVIILSARAAERDKVTGLELGAEDYVTKPFGVRELQARVANALRRIPPADEKITAGALVLVPKRREVRLDGEMIELTAKEFDLLLYLVRHAGETVSRGALLREVWGYQSEEDPSRTVDSHVKTLRIKLGDTAGEPRFIRTVRGTGYRCVSGDEA